MRATEIITELTGIKTVVSKLEPDAGHDQWEDLLTRYGFTPIGKGYHGQVYTNPKFDYVLKVFTKDDIAYQDWYKICKGPLKGNPYVPVFRGGIVRLTPNALAVRIESLTLASLKHIELARQIQRMLTTSKQNKQDWLSTDLAAKLDDDLIEVISYIAATANKSKYMLDIRAANVMARAGQLVIIDPLA
jgi:hypothetical protein